MKYAVIDMGTNSIRLLCAEIENGKIINCKKELEVTRLGFKVDETGKLDEESMKNSINAVKKFVSISSDGGYEVVGVFATSAVRDSTNGKKFADALEDEAKVAVEIISGDEEASLGYLGVMAGLDDVQGNILIIDIGGGSTELIVCSKEGIKYKRSFNLGAVRQTGRHITKDPVIKEELDKVILDIKGVLSDDIDALRGFDIGFAVGIGGTATTFGAIDLKLEEYNRESIHNHTMDKISIAKINDRLRNVDLDDRKRIPGLQPKRADIIIAGGIILEEILEELELEKMIVSDFDNLEGILVKKDMMKL
jgi:exopolyphosphatase/guanosine-5'-triphosphate,3'-diphosphate pyrophosphatase